MSFLEAITREKNFTLTENGALTNRSSFSGLVDFYASAGANRYRNNSEVLKLFYDAYEEDKFAALVLLFYIRDIRGGQGERKAFRTILKSLADKDPEIVMRLMRFIPEYGRWDDLYALVDTRVEGFMFAYMWSQLKRDLEDMANEKPISLLAKWLKGTNPSSPESQRLMKKTQKAFFLSPRTYRKVLVRLRNYLNVIEQKMSANEWDEISYSAVPSQAMAKYKTAFFRHDQEGMEEYISNLKRGKATINASAVTPTEIVYSLIRSNGTEEAIFDEMWKAQPRYALENTIPVIDVSGSMGLLGSACKTDPIYSSVAFGLYCAENMNGFFRDHFITFSRSPELVRVKGESLSEKIGNVSKARWGNNTNLQAVFELILNSAIRQKVSEKNMPQRIIIFSDMEFDMATYTYSYYTYDNNVTNYQAIVKKYEEAGYQLPQLVFWNLSGKTTQFPITIEDKGVMVSGYSPAALRFLLKGEIVTPLDMVVETVQDERYAPIRKELEFLSL